MFVVDCVGRLVQISLLRNATVDVSQVIGELGGDEVKQYSCVGSGAGCWVQVAGGEVATCPSWQLVVATRPARHA